MKLKFIQKVMNKKSNKNFLNKRLAVIGILLSLFAGGLSATYYFIQNNNFSASAYSIDNCMVDLTAAVEWRNLEFAAFLEIHFSSKKNNTYLIPDAVKGFIEYKKGVLEIMEKYEIGYIPTKSQAVQIDACMRIATKKMEDAKKMLIDKVKNVSDLKHGQIMIEKYRNINTKLSELNIEIGKIAGAFEGFYQKFPGYSEDCLTTE